MEPIDDYIEPIIALKSHVASIEKHLMRSDCESACKELESAEAAMVKLRNWCWKHCSDN